MPPRLEQLSLKRIQAFVDLSDLCFVAVNVFTQRMQLSLQTVICAADPLQCVTYPAAVVGKLADGLCQSPFRRLQFGNLEFNLCSCSRHGGNVLTLIGITEPKTVMLVTWVTQPSGKGAYIYPS